MSILQINYILFLLTINPNALILYISKINIISIGILL